MAMNRPSGQTHSHQDKGQSRLFLKLLSLFASITLWFYVLNSEPIEVTRDFTLSFITPPGLALNIEAPKTVQVRLKGNRAIIDNMPLSNDKLFIELKNFPYTQESFPVTIDEKLLKLPFSIDVLQIEPSQIVLSLEKEIKKFVPVRVKLVEELPPELKLTNSAHEPSEVMISGPRSVLKKIGRLNTAPVDLSNLDGKGKVRLAYDDLDPRIKIEGNNYVQFFFNVRPNKANKIIENVPIRFISIGNNYRSETKQARIDVLVPDNELENYGADDFRIMADIPSKATGKIRVPLKVLTPEGTHLLQIRPESINVWID